MTTNSFFFFSSPDRLLFIIMITMEQPLVGFWFLMSFEDDASRLCLHRRGHLKGVCVAVWIPVVSLWLCPLARWLPTVSDHHAQPRALSVLSFPLSLLVSASLYFGYLAFLFSACFYVLEEVMTVCLSSSLSLRYCSPLIPSVLLTVSLCPNLATCPFCNILIKAAQCGAQFSLLFMMGSSDSS